MERVADIQLIKPEYRRDSIGQRIGNGESVRELICTINGISREEWSAAAQAGLNPECMAFLRDSEDYEGEELAQLNGVRYAIYRTYLTGDGGIELYLRRNTGDNI